MNDPATQAALKIYEQSSREKRVIDAADIIRTACKESGRPLAEALRWALKAVEAASPRKETTVYAYGAEEAYQKAKAALQSYDEMPGNIQP